jgi:hypothetical protein
MQWFIAFFRTTASWDWFTGVGLSLMLTCPAAAQNAGRVVAWGGSRQNTPQGLTNVSALAAALDHTLAVTADGSVVAWGYNFDGQCDVPRGLGRVLSVAAGAFFSLALKADGTVAAWGDNQFGQCDVPAGLGQVTRIAAGRGHALALGQDGTVVAWGDKDYGQCDVPPELGEVADVFAHWNYSLALKRDGTVVAWGANDLGQTEVPLGLTEVVAVTGNINYCLALKRDGSLVGWGRYPAPPVALGNVTHLAAGENHVLATVGGQGLIGWGGAESGQSQVPAGLGETLAIGAAWHYSVAVLAGAPPLEPFSLTRPRLEAGSFAISLTAESGRAYALEYKENLADLQWVALPSVPGNGAELTLRDTAPPGVQRFYRVRRD